MTEFETTELLSKQCPDCNDISLILGVEIVGGKSIIATYQIFCEHEEKCGFTHKYREVEKVYVENYASVDEAKQEAIDMAYKEALKHFETDF